MRMMSRKLRRMYRYRVEEVAETVRCGAEPEKDRENLRVVSEAHWSVFKNDVDKENGCD
jgi:hypothetical protein